MTTVHKWDRFELQLESPKIYTQPLQSVSLQGDFTSPTGEHTQVDGFWDGAQSWHIRFAPNAMGTWTFITTCTDTENTGLHGQTGEFNCVEPIGTTRFQQHGPLQLSENGHFLAHEDGTPFFWLADTAWNGPLLSTDEDWKFYIQERLRQKFTAVQWVATQWIASPKGDRHQELAYTGTDSIQVNPVFFQQLDKKLDALNEAGLLGVPVMLWAASWGDAETMAVNPGLSLPEDQAILLARYMQARWGANHVVWILNGDGSYGGARAERWQRIGRAVFGGSKHAPVSLHPGGQQWNVAEFGEEPWLNILGYQSNHVDSAEAFAWLLAGKPATDWKLEPHRPIINLEPCYEDHLSLFSKERFTAFDIRRIIYWSLLVSPTAGVTYGGHGVWAWDNGTTTPAAHPLTGIPLAWDKALLLPGAEQMQYLQTFFTNINWWRLMPFPDLLDPQPYKDDPARANVASRTEAGDLAVIYIPLDTHLRVNTEYLKPEPQAQWFNPRTGEYSPAQSSHENEFVTPGVGDWVLLFSI